MILMTPMTLYDSDDFDDSKESNDSNDHYNSDDFDSSSYFAQKLQKWCNFEARVRSPSCVSTHCCFVVDVMCLETGSFQLIRMQKAKSVSTMKAHSSLMRTHCHQ